MGKILSNKYGQKLLDSTKKSTTDAIKTASKTAIQNSRFNGVYSRDYLPKIKDGAYVINLDEYSDIGTHWVALYNQKNVIYFDTFGVEHIPNEIKPFIDCSLSITTNIFRIQAYESIMWDIFVFDLLSLCLQERP